MKESVKIDKAILTKIRQRIKKTKHTIGGFIEVAAEQLLSDYRRLEESEKAAKDTK